MKTKGVFWLALAILSALGAQGQSAARIVRPSTPPPQHPAFNAPDAEWDRWHAAHSTWLQNLDFRSRYEALGHEAAKAAENPDAYDWRVEARYRGLTLRQIEQLTSDGVIATGRAFHAGKKPDTPLESVFVTSDMLLHAYNRMATDFVRGMEMQRAPRFRLNLEQVWSDLAHWARLHQVPQERARPALAHAQRVIGTALLCLDTPITFADPTVETDCLLQRDLILAAASVATPTWLASADGDFAGIDYQRMKPVGFYAENETLARLFRAVRWLQAVPFRPDRDTELTAAAILAGLAETSGLGKDDQLQRQWLGLPNSLAIAELDGLGDLVVDSLRLPGSAPDLARLRAALVNRFPPVHANDDLRIDPTRSGRPSSPPILKVLPAYLTADSFLFSEILKQDSSRLPEGRMITAYLGDATAIDELSRAGWTPDVLRLVGRASTRRSAAWAADPRTLLSTEPYEERVTFNSQLLHTWAALFLPPPAGAPSFLASAAWHAKSRNTVLAAWAEKKHTWVLHEVEPMGYAAGMGPPPPPPGLIEPNPEFFQRLTVLANATLRWLETSGFLERPVFTTKDRDDAAALLRLARRIRELGLDTVGNPGGKVEREALVSDRAGISRPNVDAVVPPEYKWSTLTAADFASVRAAAILSAEAILQGLDAAAQTAEVSHPPVNRRMRWETFLKCLNSLEAMSRKQLRADEWTEAERDYLTFGVWRDYHLMTQMGDTDEQLDPKSLGPKIAPVAFNPNSGEVLHAATGEMSEIYVLYPWKGHAFLYRGPVTPYYEFPSVKRLNDDDWRALLGSASPPRQPAWLAPFTPGSPSSPLAP